MTKGALAQRLDSGLSKEERKQLRETFVEYLVDEEQDPLIKSIDPDTVDSIVVRMSVKSDDWNDVPGAKSIWQKIAAKDIVKTLQNAMYGHCATLLKRMEAYRKKEAYAESEFVDDMTSQIETRSQTQRKLQRENAKWK